MEVTSTDVMGNPSPVWHTKGPHDPPRPHAGPHADGRGHRYEPANGRPLRPAPPPAGSTARRCQASSGPASGGSRGDHREGAGGGSGKCQSATVNMASTGSRPPISRAPAHGTTETDRGPYVRAHLCDPKPTTGLAKHRRAHADLPVRVVRRPIKGRSGLSVRVTMGVAHQDASVLRRFWLPGPLGLV